MNTQTLRRLGIILGVLLLVWAVMSLTRRARQDTEQRFALTRFDPKSVDQIIIARNSDTSRFTRQGASWTVNGHPANGVFIDELLRSLSDTTARSELVAENASSHQQLGLDSASARRISVRQGSTTLSELLVGRGGTYGSAYVRKPGQNAAYQLTGSLSESADRAADDWRDRTIAKIDADSIASVEVHRGKTSYTLTRAEKGWLLGSAPSDSGAAANLVNSFRSIEAAGFATAAQADSASFSPPDREVRVTGKGGQMLVALTMDSTANAFWVRKAGDPTTYRLETWTANQLTPADSTLRMKK